MSGWPERPVSDGQGRNIGKNRSGANNGSNVRNEGSNVLVRKRYFFLPSLLLRAKEKKRLE